MIPMISSYPGKNLIYITKLKNIGTLQLKVSQLKTIISAKKAVKLQTQVGCISSFTDSN